MTLRTPKPTAKQATVSALPEHITHWCLLAAVFLVPAFFLPLTTDALELNKALLFFLLMLVAGIAWLFQMVMRRGSVMIRTPLDVLIAVYMLLNIVIAAFSVFHYRSIVGTNGYFSNALVSVLFFAAFFVLCVQTIRREHVRKFLGAFLLSGAVVVLFNYLQVFNVFILPWSFAKQVSFNGASNSLTVFTVYLALVGMAALLTALRTVRPVVRTLCALLAVLALFLLTVYDQPVSWYVVVAGMVLLLVMLNAVSRALRAAWVLLPALVIGYAIIALFINTQSLFKANIPGDVALPFSTARVITWDAVKHAPLLGTGQETFDTVFARYRPAAYNMTAFWSVRFLKSSNEWLQLASTVGPVTALVFAALTIMYLLHLFRAFLATKFEDPQWWYRAGILILAVMLFVGSLFTAFNFLAAFLFWLLLAFGSILTRSRQPSEGTPPARETLSVSGQQRAFGASLGFAAVVVLGIIFLYFAGRFWVADHKVEQASERIAKQEPLDVIQTNLANAVDLNPYEQGPYFQLARNALVQAQLAAQKKDADVTQIRNFIASSVAAAQAGAARYPAFSGSYEALSSIFGEIDTLTGATSAETDTAFTKATELEPNNPQLFFNLGQHQLTVAQAKIAAKNDPKDTAIPAEATTALTAAKTAFEHAYALKADYTDAAINVALVLRVEGKGPDAVKYMEDLAAKFPLNTDVLFNLAENYRLDSRQDDALAAYLRIVSIYPGHSDAHFRLAQIYEAKGQKDKAIAEYTIVKQYNPGNADVVKKLEELQPK